MLAGSDRPGAAGCSPSLNVASGSRNALRSIRAASSELDPGMHVLPLQASKQRAVYRSSPHERLIGTGAAIPTPNARLSASGLRIAAHRCTGPVSCCAVTISTNLQS